MFQDTEFWSKEAYRTSIVNNGEYLVALGAGGGSGGAISLTASGAGGAGGGGILVTAGEVYNGGTISANGASGGNGENKKTGAGGGGGGGAVVIIARRIGNAGTITANGGAAGTGISVSAAGEDGFVYMKEVDGL